MDVDFQLKRTRRHNRPDVRVAVAMRFEVVEGTILFDEIDVAAGNNMTAIYKVNQCKQKSCKDFCRTRVSPGNSGRVAPNSRALAKWNDAINKETRTIHEPPRDVIGDLL